MKNLLLIIMFLLVNQAFGQKVDYIPGQLVVQFKRDFDFNSIFKNQNLKTIKPILQLINTIDADWNFHLVTFDTLDYSNTEILSIVNNWKSVLSVQLNYIANTRTVEPNDAQYLNTQKWVMDKIKAPDMWSITTGGATACGDNPVIAVLDYGFDIQHEELKNNLWVNPKEIPNDGKDNDGNGFIDDINGIDAISLNGTFQKEQHGTACLGVIGAKGNNTLGITGVNWSCKMMPLGNAGTLAQILSLYSYTKNMRIKYNDTNGQSGAFVVATSFSAGFDTRRPADLPGLCNVYDLLGQVGILNVVATSNSNIDIEVNGDMPSLCPSDYLISVTSVDNKDDSYRAYSKISVDIASPGEKVQLLDINNAYTNKSGTSFATPIVTGAIGLLYAAPSLKKMCEESKTNNASLTAFKIKKSLLDNVTKAPSLANKIVSGGILNLLNTFGALNKIYNAPDSNTPEGIIYVSVAYNKIIIQTNFTELKDYVVTVSNPMGKVILNRTLTLNEFFNGNIVLENDLIPGLYAVSIINEKQVYSKMFRSF
jgi:Subtilase family